MIHEELCSELFLLSQASFLLATLRHNWHRSLYTKRGGKRQIKDWIFALVPVTPNNLGPLSSSTHCRTGHLTRQPKCVPFLGTCMDWRDVLIIQGDWWGLCSGILQTTSSYSVGSPHVKEPEGTSPENAVFEDDWKGGVASQPFGKNVFGICKSVYDSFRHSTMIAGQYNAPRCTNRGTWALLHLQLFRCFCWWTCQDCGPQLELAVHVDEEPIWVEAEPNPLHNQSCFPYLSWMSNTVQDAAGESEVLVIKDHFPFDLILQLV